MNCPNCGKDMEAGFLQSHTSTPIAWVRKKLPFGLGYWKTDAEIVSEEAGIGYAVIPTHICKQCKLLLGDYSHKE